VKSKVFSIDIHNHPDSQQVWVYRTDGTANGGGLRFYNLTTSRLIRLLRAMVNISTQVRCYTHDYDEVSSWYVAGAVEQMYAAQAALAAA